MTYPTPPLSRNRRSISKLADGIVTECSSRLTKNGSQAHSFRIGRERYTYFSNDDLAPVVEGDSVRFEYKAQRLQTGSRREYFSVLTESLVVSVPVGLDIVVQGHVYVMSNPSMVGLLKVGFTTGPVSKRMAELSGVTSIPTKFQVEWSCAVVGNAWAVEQRAHAHLSDTKVGKEFFKVSISEAKTAVIQSFVELYPNEALMMDEAFRSLAQREIIRREAMGVLKATKEIERKEQEAQLIFDKSRTGLWHKNGSVIVVLKEWKVLPVTHRPSVLAKLFGAKAEDYIEIKATAGQHGDKIEWRYSVVGRFHDKDIYVHEVFESKEETLSRIEKDDIKYRQINGRSSITVPNIIINNPPVLPDSNGNTSGTLTIASIEGLILRPITKPNRSRLTYI